MYAAVLKTDMVSKVGNGNNQYTKNKPRKGKASQYPKNNPPKGKASQPPDYVSNSEDQYGGAADEKKYHADLASSGFEKGAVDAGEGHTGKFKETTYSHPNGAEAVVFWTDGDGPGGDGTPYSSVTFTKKPAKKYEVTDHRIRGSFANDMGL